MGLEGKVAIVTGASRGIGAAIVRRLVAEARNRGIEKTYLETSESGRSLYRSLGFAEMPDMMILGDGK